MDGSMFVDLTVQHTEEIKGVSVNPVLEMRAQDCSGELNAVDKHSRKFRTKSIDFCKQGMTTLPNKNTSIPT